jgi:hypothetical protein
VASLEDTKMVPIIRLRRTKKTAGVNQLFIEVQIDMDSSSMIFGWD